MGWGLAEKWNPRLSKPYGVGSGQTLNPTTEAAPTALRTGCVLCCVCVLGRDYAQLNFFVNHICVGAYSASAIQSTVGNGRGQGSISSPGNSQQILMTGSFI